MSNPTHDTVAELRAKYPTVSDGFFDLIETRDRAEQALSDLRTELAHLCGYYLDREGIPVAEIRALLDGDRR